MTEDQKFWYDKGADDSKRALTHYIREHPHGMSQQDVINELLDYQTLGDNLTKVYSRITGGMITKPFTNASAIINEYEKQLKLSYDVGYENAEDLFNKFND